MNMCDYSSVCKSYIRDKIDDATAPKYLPDHELRDASEQVLQLIEDALPSFIKQVLKARGL